MSRNYTHTRISRLSSSRRKKYGNIKLYAIIAIILALLVFLSRDITPDYFITEKDVTQEIKAGEFVE